MYNVFTTLELSQLMINKNQYTIGVQNQKYLKTN